MSIWKQKDPDPEPVRVVLPRCGCCGQDIKAETYHHIEFLGLGFNVCPRCLKKWKRKNEEMEELKNEVQSNLYNRIPGCVV